MENMYDIIETIVTHATDVRVIFAAASVFGYCLYKLMTMGKRKNNKNKYSEDSEDTDNNVVRRQFFCFICLLYL